MKKRTEIETEVFNSPVVLVALIKLQLKSACARLKVHKLNSSIDQVTVGEAKNIPR